MRISLTSGQKRQFIFYIDLLASAVNNTQPPKLPDDFKWDFICRNAQRNSVLNILAYAVGKCDCNVPETVWKVMENDRRYNILKETSQLVEVEKILQEFEKSHIKNIPLKGYFMKHLYPQTDYRTMTDVDILVSKKDFKKITEIFRKLSYSEKNVIKSDEIHFSKDFQYFEIQSDLNENNDSYYDNIWSRVSLRDDYNYSFSMSGEDFYIYMIYHCAKHFKGGGIGIRMVMDIYVYLNAYKNMNLDYINSQLAALDLVTFEKNLRELSLNWFSDSPTRISKLGEFVLYCSTYGMRDIFFYQDGSENKFSYWIKQIFIPYSNMKSKYSYLSKFPLLLPFSWIQYWFTRIFIKRDLNLKSGFSDRVQNLDEENALFVKNLINDLEIN